MEEVIRYACNSNVLAESSNDLKLLLVKVKEGSANRAAFAHQEDKNGNDRRTTQL